MTDKAFSLDDVRALLEANVSRLAKDVTVDDVMAEMISAQATVAATSACESKGITENVSDAVAFLFETAAKVSEIIPMTAGDPNGGNKNTRADRHMFEVATPSGRLQIHLYSE